MKQDYALIMQQISDYIDKHNDEMITLLQELVRVPSVALTIKQEDCQDIMERELRAAGAKVDRWIPDWEEVKKITYPNTHETIYQAVEMNHPEYIEVRDKVSVVVGTFESDKPGKTLLFNGHIDTAGVGNIEEWKHNPWGAEIEDGKMYGRATADQKGGVVASLYGVMAAKAVIRSLPGKISIVVTPEEETGGNGTAASIQRGYCGDGVILTDISNNEVVVSNSGMQDFEIMIRGGSDGSMWNADYSVSAAELLAIVIQRIHAFAAERDAHARKAYGFRSDETAACINPGSIECGEWHASVPATARIKGLMAVLPDDNLIELRELFKKRITSSEGVPYFLENPPKINFGSAREGCVTSLDAPLVEAAKKALYMLRKKEVSPKYGNVSSDMTFYPALYNMPAILFGPGENLHCPDEYILLDQFKEIAKAYALTIILYMQE